MDTFDTREQMESSLSNDEIVTLCDAIERYQTKASLFAVEVCEQSNRIMRYPRSSS